MLARFGEYLSVERGLTAPVIEAYTRWVRPFVEQVVSAGQESDLGDIGPYAPCRAASSAGGRGTCSNSSPRQSRKGGWSLRVCYRMSNHPSSDLPPAKGTTFALYQAAQP